ncbi:hypothetical protein Pyrfu_0779 [Pyrolobus fumarii 1A]|uniref:Gingipain domain-containing protein n=1 Tax=Pyrolobus fumarii (strain DSM 11204 / 1A) TaxID=694429 RepID=G0EDG3_PYRF1|nr:C25 family cysteine peptidase [Pyrolobus fumarii]AEM38648.1 hypothetical protein Pyrfu_0779 [Pyrolobus fumarii 1A]
MSGHRRVLAAIITLVVLLAVTPILAAASSPAETLASLGVAMPNPVVPRDSTLLYEKTIYIGLNVDEDGNWSKLELHASTGKVVYVGLPGGPRLPAIHMVFELPLDTRPVVVVEPLSIQELKLVKPVEPMPSPLRLDTDKPLVRGTVESFYERVTPGVYYTYFALKLNGKKVLHIYIYPVQHHDGKVVYTSMLRVKVYAEKVEMQSESSTSPVLLVIAPTMEIAKLVAELEKSVHPNVKVVAASLENVTKAPPLFPQIPLPGILMPVYPPPPEIMQYYNFTLAAQVRGFIALAKQAYGVTHVLIVGSASEIPPSYYYLSIIEYFFVDPYNGWIPTDYLYADLDLDFNPDVYVGRLPFSNPYLIQMYFEKVKLYEEYQRSPTILVIGGYPFAMAPPVGEAGISTYSVKLGIFRNLEPQFMTRVLGNYTRENFRSLFLEKEQPAWITVIAHGSGNSWADLVYNETVNMITWEELVNATDLLEKSAKRTKIGVVTSVACMNGAWDFDLVPSPWFSPPSVGWAIAAGWGGVAYVGHARSAFEWFKIPIFAVKNGLVSANIGGAILLHGYLAKAWASGARTLGEAVWKGTVLYLNDTLSQLYPELSMGGMTVTLGHTTVLQLTLLGDPLLSLPAPLPEPKPAPNVTLSRFFKLFDASVLYMPLYVEGKMPIYKPGYTESLVVAGDGVKLASVAVERNFGIQLTALKPITIAKPGEQVKLGGKLTGNMLVGVVHKSGYVLMTASALGLYAHHEDGRLNVKVWAAQLLTMPATPVEVYIDGDLVVTSLNDSIEFSVSYDKPGVHVVYVMPRLPSPIVMYYPSLANNYLELIQELFTERIAVRLAKPLKISIGAVLVNAKDTVVVPVQVSLDDKPVDAELDVSVEGPVKPTVHVERLGKGAYLVKLAGVEPGTYTITVRAVYKGEYVAGEGITIQSVTVDKLAASVATELENKLNNKLSEIETRVEQKLEAVANEISGRIAESQDAIITALNEVQAKLASSISSVSETVKKVGEKLASEIETARAHIEKYVEDSIGKAVADVKGSISAMEERVTGKIDQVIDKTSKIEADVNYLKSEVTNVKGRLSKVEDTLTTQTSMLQAIIGVTGATLAASVALHLRRHQS